MSTINNSADVARKWPTTSLADRVLTEREGVIVEAITGPASSATVKLSRAASSVKYVLAVTTATGAVLGVPIVDTDYEVTLSDATGVCALTDLSASSHAAETWIVHFCGAGAEGNVGGQSSV